MVGVPGKSPLVLIGLFLSLNEPFSTHNGPFPRRLSWAVFLLKSPGEQPIKKRPINSGEQKENKRKKTLRDKQGSTGRCPRDFLLFAIEKRTEKGIFAGTPAGCPRDTRSSSGFSETLCDFFLCAFSVSY